MREVNTWPGWECVRQLGSGAFGKVYEIQRVEGNKTYKAALKVITVPQNQADVMNAYSEGMTEENVTLYFKSFVDDITNEFALMSDLKGYTNIVSYEDHMVVPHKDSFGWDILIRMELLTPLQKWCLDHELSEEDIIRLGCDICRALELCHKKKIIHRDIKPENIFVNNNGDFKLGDFGIARVAEKTTSVLSQKGTYTYMAPEVYKGQSYNQTVDIYSLGIVLYRFLNLNRTPFLPLGMLQFSDRQLAQERRIAGETIPAPVNGSDELKMFILKALQYEPEKRYQTASAFRKALESCIKEDSLQEEEYWVENKSLNAALPEDDTATVNGFMNDQEDKTAAVNGFMNNQEETNVSDDVMDTADGDEEKTAFESLDFHEGATVIEDNISDRDEEKSEKIEENKTKNNKGGFSFGGKGWLAIPMAIICIGLLIGSTTFQNTGKQHEQAKDSYEDSVSENPIITCNVTKVTLRGEDSEIIEFVVEGDVSDDMKTSVSLEQQDTSDAYISHDNLSVEFIENDKFEISSKGDIHFNETYILKYEILRKSNPSDIIAECSVKVYYEPN